MNRERKPAHEPPVQARTLESSPKRSRLATLLDGTFRGEQMPTSAEDLASAIHLDDQGKKDVLLSLLSIFHGNISNWTGHAYTVVLWAVGLNLGVVGFVFASPVELSWRARLAMFVGLLAFGFLIQIFLRRAARAHFGNRLAISKCEAALRLYETGEYLAGRPFFTYSRKMLESRNLHFLAAFQLTVTLLCAGFVLLGRPA